jgi:hypothetical protein
MELRFALVPSSRMLERRILEEHTGNKAMFHRVRCLL